MVSNDAGVRREYNVHPHFEVNTVDGRGEGGNLTIWDLLQL